MKYFLLTTLLSTMLINIPTAMAQDHSQHGHGMSKMHHDDDWHATLSKPQQIKVDKSHLTYLQKVSPVKAKIKAARIELALLVTKGTQNKDEIEKRDADIATTVAEIARLTGEKMQLKAVHQIEVRAILNEEQRMKFDLHVLNKASQGKTANKHH